MKSMTILVMLISFLSCKDNQNPFRYNQESSNNDKQNTTNSSTILAKNDEEKTVWNEVKFKNLTFSLPSNFQLENNLSNYNKKVYTAHDETLGLTIDIGDLPSGYENSIITEMIPNLDVFGNSINQDNKTHFDDFKLINSKYTYLGDNKSVEVTQTSTKISDKNISMVVKAYFIIAYPYYCSVTFSYPGNSFQGEQTIDNIKKSFKSDILQTSSNQNNTSTTSNEPSLKASQEWLVNKLSSNLVEYYNSTSISYGPITFWHHYYKSVGINDGNLVIEYQEKIDSPKGYGEIGHNTTLQNIKVLIPFKKINNNKFNNYRSSSGKCNFTIYTDTNAITEMNYTTGKESYSSSYEFSFDCSEEEDLGARFDKAILHIKNLTPTKIRENNEPF